MDSERQSAVRDSICNGSVQDTLPVTQLVGLARLADFTRNPSLAPEIPRVPLLVRFYGTAIMLLNAVAMAFGVLLIIVNQIALVPAVVSFGVSIVFFRLGEGLRRGERQAVLGLCVCGGISLLCSFVLLSNGARDTGFIVALLAVILYVPPIVAAFTRWSSFE